MSFVQTESYTTDKPGWRLGAFTRDLPREGRPARETFVYERTNGRGHVLEILEVGRFEGAKEPDTFESFSPEEYHSDR